MLPFGPSQIGDSDSFVSDKAVAGLLLINERTHEQQPHFQLSS